MKNIINLLICAFCFLNCADHYIPTENMDATASHPTDAAVVADAGPDTGVTTSGCMPYLPFSPRTLLLSDYTIVVKQGYNHNVSFETQLLEVYFIDESRSAGEASEYRVALDGNYLPATIFNGSVVGMSNVQQLQSIADVPGMYVLATHAVNVCEPKYYKATMQFRDTYNMISSFAGHLFTDGQTIRIRVDHCPVNQQPDVSSFCTTGLEVTTKVRIVNDPSAI